MAVQGAKASQGQELGSGPVTSQPLHITEVLISPSVSDSASFQEFSSTQPCIKALVPSLLLFGKDVSYNRKEPGGRGDNRVVFLKMTLDP